jgi:hypothetical protein
VNHELADFFSCSGLVSIHASKIPVTIKLTRLKKEGLV